MANPFSEDQNSKQNAPPDVILAILSLQHVLFRYIVVKNSLTLPRALKNKSAVSQENDNILLHVRLNIMRSFDFNIKVKRELSRKHASSTTLLSNCDALCFYFVNENLRHKSPVFRRYTEILTPNLLQSSFLGNRGHKISRDSILQSRRFFKMGQDYYGVLGLTRSASDADIKKS